MKCKVHPYEHGVGVCASCLRERLLALIAAQNEQSVDHHYHHQQHHHRWSSDPPAPPPLVFPRSVSPYVSHRRSVGSEASPARLPHHFERFFSTPQVGPTFDAGNGDGSFGDVGGVRRRSSGKFSLLKILFGHHRSEVVESGLGGSGSSSWFSALIRRKKKISQNCQAAEWAPPLRGRRSCQAVEKGLSPDMVDEGEDGDSGYPSDSSGGWRRPTPTPMRWFPANILQHQRSSGAMSGFVVCLSPLVRVGPRGRRSQPMDNGISGDLRSPVNSVQHRQIPAGGPSIAPNRSRKLADFGWFK